jgi:hypothetical protein
MFDEVVKRIVKVWPKIQAYYAENAPRYRADCPAPGFSAHWCPRAPEEIELEQFLKAQSPATIYMLFSVMRMGRGIYYRADSLLPVYEDVKNSFCEPAWAVDQLLEKPRLAKYLRAGMAKLSKAGINVNRLEQKKRRLLTITARS